LLCKDPLLNEPGVTKYHSEFNNYTKIIEFSNIDIAICDIINKKEGSVFPFFELFEHNVQERFQTNYDDLIKFIDKKIDENKDCLSSVLTGGFYKMNVVIDYNKLKKKIMAIKNGK
jgi:hypothetical protein